MRDDMNTKRVDPDRLDDLTGSEEPIAELSRVRRDRPQHIAPTRKTKLPIYAGCLGDDGRSMFAK